MFRLLVHVEGETEETFVKELLSPHLVRRGWTMVSARLLGNARRRDRRGGIKSWASTRDEIVRHLREDDGRVVTTMVDSVARISAANSSRFETRSGAPRRSTIHRKRRLPNGWNAWSADTRSRYTALLPRWKSGSERSGASALTSNAGWLAWSSLAGARDDERIPLGSRVNEARKMCLGFIDVNGAHDFLHPSGFPDVPVTVLGRQVSSYGGGDGGGAAFLDHLMCS